MCFVWIWEQTAIISLYNINWLVFITETECVYCTVRTGSSYTASLTFSNSTFCPHSVFMCFVWIWEQTAIISLYSINWLVCITETVCVYCAVRADYSREIRFYIPLYSWRHSFHRDDCKHFAQHIISNFFCTALDTNSVLLNSRFPNKAALPNL
jgi:hypothetical protein